jgi:hypothetical protein
VADFRTAAHSWGRVRLPPRTLLELIVEHGDIGIQSDKIEHKIKIPCIIIV